MKEKINEPIYTLTGIVIHGRGIGKHVGTPTANIEIAKNTFLPKTGVYVADILLSDKIYYGVTINEQISNFAQTYPTNLKASSNEALLFMRRYRFANCSCFSCCFKDAYPSSNVQ